MKFRITEASEKLGVSPSFLRLGEAEGKLPPARRSLLGQRYFTKVDLAKLRRIISNNGNK